MKSEHVARARRIIGRRWYLRVRAWKLRIMQHHFHDVLMHGARDEQIRHFSDVMARAYAKRKWYEKKLKRA